MDCIHSDVASRLVAHDASRGFHLALARATRNPDLVSVLESLWIVEIGRRVLSTRAAESDWRGSDAREHRAIATAVADRDGDLAASLMRAHVEDAFQHWAHDDALHA